MKKSVLYLLWIALIPLSEAFGGDSVLPAWFWNTPRIDGVCVAVGYSPPYIDAPYAFDVAFNDAAWRLYGDRVCRIAGEKGVASTPEGLMDMGSTIKQVVDSSGFESFRERIFRIDSVATEHLRAVLIATADIDVDKTLQNAPPLELDCSGCNIAQSSAPIYYHYSSSWIEAERDARIELAVSTAADLSGCSLYRDDNMFSTSIIKTDIILSSVQTIHRRIDSENGIVKLWVIGSGIDNTGYQP